MFVVFEIKKKHAHIIKRLDILYSNFNDTCCVFVHFKNTENNYYIIQNACEYIMHVTYLQIQSRFFNNDAFLKSLVLVF